MNLFHKTHIHFFFTFILNAFKLRITNASTIWQFQNVWPNFCMRWINLFGLLNFCSGMWDQWSKCMKTVSNFVYVCDKAIQIHALITNKKDRLDNQQRKSLPQVWAKKNLLLMITHMIYTNVPSKLRDNAMAGKNETGHKRSTPPAKSKKTLHTYFYLPVS